MFSVLLYAFFGFLIGVLINRAADNLPPPARRSLFEAPRCPYCGTVREWWQQSGLISLLFLRRRCPQCNRAIRLRAPIVELLTALLFGYLWSRSGLGWAVAAASLFTVVLLLITVVDVEHRLILNVLVLPATLLAIFTRPPGLMIESPGGVLLDWLYGAAVGYLVVFGFYLLGAAFAQVVGRWRGRPIDEVAFGLGDVKLAGLVGALLGFPTIIFALFYAVLFGGVAGLGVLLFQLLVRRRYVAFMAIPYGPFFTITAWLFMIHVL